MRSHLTRQVFRRILQTELLGPVHAACPNRTIELHQARRHGHGSIRIRAPSHRRTLFGLSRKPDPWLQEPDLHPGLETMLELTSQSALKDRPPPADQLAAAFREFFLTKLKNKEMVQEIQAFHALRTFRYLQEMNQEQEGFGLTLKDLRTALSTLVLLPEDDLSTHNQFARALFEEILKRGDGKKDADDINPVKPEMAWYVRILCESGDALEARDLLERSSVRNNAWRKMWSWVLKGLAKKGDDEELQRTLFKMKSYGTLYNMRAQAVMVEYYALKDDVDQTKYWFAYDVDGRIPPTPHTMEVVLQFCIRKNELEWGLAVLQSFLRTDLNKKLLDSYENPRKRIWDGVFQWAAAMGKGVDQIDRMMRVMVRENEADETVRPDIDTINGLIKLANSRNKAYEAERYVVLAEKWGLVPNAMTYVLQLDYRLNVEDIDGALVTYNKLQGEDVRDGVDIPVVNKLVRALCTSKHIGQDTVLTVLDDLNERKARLEPETVSVLCVWNLQRDELREIISLIKDHTWHYSMDQRGVVSDTFIRFITDRANPTGIAWDAYTILCHAFDEISVASRIDLMNEFFARGRSDMASHVFGHMRQHQLAADRPTAEAYTACFEGIARAADAEALEMVHNMLKLDGAIEPDTRLYNALMLAYAACDMPERALEYWHDIGASREGPTYNSICIALRACEASWNGVAAARNIWARLKSMKIEVTREVFAAYVAVLAAHGLMKDACKLVGEVHKVVGTNPDVYLWVFSLLLPFPFVMVSSIP